MARGSSLFRKKKHDKRNVSRHIELERLEQLERDANGLYLIDGVWTPPAPRLIKDRIEGKKYILRGSSLAIWRSYTNGYGKWHCIHDRRITVCPTCGGGSLCIHEKRRELCSKCKNPRFFCVHGTAKRQCRLCRGSSFCVHDKVRSRCAICSPHTRCHHGKIWRECVACGRPGQSKSPQASGRKIRINIIGSC